MVLNETPTLSQVIKDAIEARLADLHTVMPAEIVDYDPIKNTISAQPLLKRKYSDGSIVDLPVIPNVPVAILRAGSSYMSLPLQKGDNVILIFAERSIDTWKLTGGSVDPDDPRKHALSDAIAIASIYPALDPPIGIDADEWIISHNGATLTFMQDGAIEIAGPTATVTLTSSGAISIVNNVANLNIAETGDISFDSGTVQGLFGSGGKVKFSNVGGELIDVLSSLLDAISTGTVPTALGPQTLIMPTFAVLKAKLDSFKA